MGCQGARFDGASTYLLTYAQVFDATCDGEAMCTDGEEYKASTTGPFQCYKADVAQSEGSSALLSMTTSSAYKTNTEMEV